MAYAYPVKVEGRYVMDPSPAVRQSETVGFPGAQLVWCGAGAAHHALPPFTQAVSLDFEDHPFEACRKRRMTATCGRCGGQ